jgi:hypothetical protein
MFSILVLLSGERHPVPPYPLVARPTPRLDSLGAPFNYNLTIAITGRGVAREGDKPRPLATSKSDTKGKKEGRYHCEDPGSRRPWL